MLIEIIQEEGHIWDTLEKNLNSHMNCAQRFDGPHGQIIKGRQKNGVFVCVLVTQSCLTLCNPHTVAHQASLSMEFSRQEYWSGLPFPSPEELPNPGIKTWSPASQADSLLFELKGNNNKENRDYIDEANRDLDLENTVTEMKFSFRGVK